VRGELSDADHASGREAHGLAAVVRIGRQEDAFR
jgi:hypothetical protein